MRESEGFHSVIRWMKTICIFWILLSYAQADGLKGLVMCGYQGWFRCEGDGAGVGWHHYDVNGKFEPGHSHIELWPDSIPTNDSPLPSNTPMAASRRSSVR